MSDSEPSPPKFQASRVLPKKKGRLSLVWIVPIVASLVGVWVAVVTIRSQGPKITIVFRSAEGMEAGKTKIQYNGVEIGTVASIRLSEDHRSVVLTANMVPKSEGFLVADSRFWVVRPRVSGANVTGLGTLISGAYIGMEIGKSPLSKNEFVGLENPPVVTGEIAGRFFILRATDLGSIDYGTPIYFRRLNVGQVASYELDKDAKAISVKVFIEAPYDQYVTPETRFWHASGIDVSLSASGVSVQTPSVLAMIIGGLAFETVPVGAPLPPAEANSVFTLFGNRAEAFKAPPQNPQTYILIFRQSVRGLARGAPVELRGIQIGEVEDVHAEFDPQTLEYTIPVTIRVDPRALGVRFAEGTSVEGAAAQRKLINALVAHGLRAQLRTGSLLTGALFVAVDFFPDAPPFTVDWTKQPAVFPTVPGKLEGVEANLDKIMKSSAELLKKLNEVPYPGIAEDIRKVLESADETLATTRKTLEGADRLVQSTSGMDQELAKTIEEVRRAAAGLRVLADELERHPEAIIHGKPQEKK